MQCKGLKQKRQVKMEKLAKLYIGYREIWEASAVGEGYQ